MPAQKPNDADVVKWFIDPMYVKIPASPFPKSGRWSFEQLKLANIAMGAAIKAENEKLAKTPNAKLLSTTTEIEQNMAWYGMGDGFIRDFARHETFENLKVRYSRQCGDLAAFVSRYYPNGVPTAGAAGAAGTAIPAPTPDGQLPQELIDAKTNPDKSTRYSAVRSIMKIQYSKEFNKAFYENYLHDVIKMFPKEGEDFMALMKEYRTRKEDAG